MSEGKGKAKRGGGHKGAKQTVSADEGAGLYLDCLGEGDRLALTLAGGSGLEQEMAVVRLLIRRAILDGRPAREVAQLLNCLAGLLKTQHVLAGKNAKQLDEALAAALDAIAAEIGVNL